MAELATIARPYAEALYRSSASASVADQLDALAVVAGDPALMLLAGSPSTTSVTLVAVIGDVLRSRQVELSPGLANLLQAIIDNGRVAALPEIAAQYRSLVNAQSGVVDARVESAFELQPAQLSALLPALEKRFGRKLNPLLSIQPELIGGIRVVVGDEVLDASVRARLEQMKAALTA